MGGRASLGLDCIVRARLELLQLLLQARERSELPARVLQEARRRRRVGLQFRKLRLSLRFKFLPPASVKLNVCVLDYMSPC